MTRREFTSTALATSASVASLRTVSAATGKLNVIHIMLDDLGTFDLGCYGSKSIQTPHIDALAKESMKFTQAYAGCTVCAPARSTLMTGKHMGHTAVRTNPGGVPIQASDVTLAQVLKGGGYKCGGFGKWGLGDIDTAGVPEKHGFDRFYGYYHQVHAHHYFPEYLIDTGKKAPLAGNDGMQAQREPGPVPDKDPKTGVKHTFSHYVIRDEMLKWIRANASGPFYCYAPWTIPHGLYRIPESDPAWQLYKDKPWSINARVYASFVTMADRFVGETLALLKELKLEQNTLVIFTSDNGAANPYKGELESTGALRGQKTNMYEGGIRSPMLARLPGAIKAGSTSDLPVYFPDFMPTIAEFTGTTQHVPKGIDGISLVAELTGKKKLDRNRPLYWEFTRGHMTTEYKPSMQAMRRGKWKIVRHELNGAWELYDLMADPSETKNLASDQPKIVAEMESWVQANRSAPPPQIEPEKPKGQQWR
jgi:arylsulfatase A-like enzyme